MKRKHDEPRSIGSAWVLGSALLLPWFSRCRNGRRLSIGIEFANAVWVNAGWSDADFPDRRAIEIEWQPPHGKLYSVPSLDALESLTAVVRWLLDDPNLSIPPIWPQVMIIPSTGRPGFLMAMTGDELPLANRERMRGIVAHRVIGPHADGSFQALYTWLRLQGPDGQGISDASEAFQTAVALAENGTLVRAEGKFFIDLADL